MIRRNALLGLAAILILAVIAVSAYATESPDGPNPAPSSSNTLTWIGVAILIVSNVGIWMDKVVAANKERRACAEAEAEEAKAEASFSPVQMAQLASHETKLSNHDIEIAALKNSFAKYERENRDDHRQIFDRLDGIKDLIIGKKGN